MFKQKIKSLLLYFLILILGSCAQVTSLNLRKHQFGQLPTKIIWIQVAGFNEEHIALLKYSYPSSDSKTYFENFLCMGKAWEYNLFDLRPSYQASFISQLTGKKNVRGTCEDYNIRPIWSYMIPNGYSTGVFEGEMPLQDSLIQANNCNENNFLNNTIVWKMNSASKINDANLFHLSEKTNFKTSSVYYDRSCSTGECFSTFARNVEAIYNNHFKNKENHLFIIRNTKFQKAILDKNIAKAKEELGQINQIVSFFQKVADKRTDLLVLLTSASPLGVEFPRSGREWENFEASKKYDLHKQTKLIGTVMASGARSENFCGMYEQSEIMSRIFSGAKQQGLELAIINPFQ